MCKHVGAASDSEVLIIVLSNASRIHNKLEPEQLKISSSYL